MKKLIAMIGAAAMAFGLYADEPAVYDGTSFEAGEAGVSDDGKTWTASGLWSTTYEDPFNLCVYAGDKDKYDYGTNPRRDGKGTEDNVFPLENKNENCLELSTGTNTLTRTTGGKNYFDQVVKFTGFEEAQTNFVEGTKIAIWTSAIDANDDNVAGETNLYVAVGTGDGSDPIKNVKIEVGDDFDFNAWHRITIQNLGEVAQDRAGFLVWIDGIRAEIDDDDSEYFTKEVSDAFRKYYEDDQLFIAMQTGTAVSGVGFAGRGWIDDVAVTAVGPKFTDLSVEVTVATIPGANIVVKDAAGNPIGLKDGKYAIPAGDFTVTYTAQPGYKFAQNKKEMTVRHNTADEQPIDDSETVNSVAVVATKNGTVEYAEDELYGMITTLADGDVVLFNEGAAVTNGEGTAFYEFTANTTIGVTGNEGAITWDVAVSNVDESAGSFTDNVGVSAGNTLNVWFEMANDAFMTLTEDVAGTLNVEVGTLLVDTAITVAGTIKAAALDISETITLSGDGKVETKVEDDLTDYFNSEEGDVVRTGPQDGWYTYQIDAADYVAQIGDKKYTTLKEAFDAVEGETEDPVTITLIKSCEGDGIALWAADKKNIILDLNGETYTCVKNAVGSTGTESQGFHVEDGNTLVIKNGTITSRAGSGVKMLINNYTDMTLEDVTLDGTNLEVAHKAGTETVVPNYTFSNNGGTVMVEGNTSIIATPTRDNIVNYALDACKTAKVTLNTTGTITGNIEVTAGENGSFTYTAGTINGEVQHKGAAPITGFAAETDKVAYKTFAEAFAAAGAGSTLKLLADVALDVTVGNAITFDVNGHTATVAEGTTLTLNAKVTLANSVPTAGGFLNEGTIAANADLDLSAFAWGQGGLLPTTKTGVKIVIAANVTAKFAAGNNPNTMEQNMTGFLSDSADGALFTNGTATYTFDKTATKWYIGATAEIAFAGGVTEADWVKGGSFPEVTVTETPTGAAYTGSWNAEYPAENPSEDTTFTYTVTFTGEYKGADVTKTFKVKKVASFPPYIPDDPVIQKKYSDWATEFGVTDPAAAKEDAFLLNCANTDEEIVEAKKAFKFTSIVAGTTPTAENVTEGYKSKTWNGKVVIKAYATPDCKGQPVVAPAGDETELFYQATLELIPANE